MNVLEVIVLAIGLELVVLMFLLVVTLVTQARKSGRKTQRLSQLWHGLLSVALSGEPRTVLGIRDSLDSRAKWKAFHAFVDKQLRRGRGHSLMGMRLVCRQVGLTERLQRELRGARNPLDRAAAARTLGHLQERVAEETVLGLLSSKDPAVVLAAAHAAASFRDPRQFLAVFRAIYGRTQITLYGATELLSAFEEDICPTVHRLLEGVVAQYGQSSNAALAVRVVDPERVVDRHDVPVQVVMIDLLAFYAYRPAARTVLRLLTLCEDEEVLIHLVKAIAMVGDATAVPAIAGLLTHPNWVVRSQSAQTLGALGAVETLPSLIALRTDENSAVRICANESVCILKMVETADAGKVTVALP